MISNYFFVIDIWLLLGLIGGGLVVVIILYIIFNQLRLSQNIKKYEKKMDKFEGKDDEHIIELIQLLYNSSKYNGRFSSLSGKAKRETKKFLSKWFNYVPSYVTFKLEKEQKRYENIYIDLYKSDQEMDKPSKKCWGYVPEKKISWNKRKLFRFMNKYKVTRGTIEVISHIFEYEKDNSLIDKPTSFDNDYTINYNTRSKKKAKLKDRKEIKKKKKK